MASFPWRWRLDDLSAPRRGTVFSTFACGGGSSMGYKRAGYDVLGCVEIDPEINRIYRANLHPRHNYLMDLREFNALKSVPDELMRLDILDGSPPCSTFSMAGAREEGWGREKVFREGQARQRLDDLFFTYLDTVDRLRPKVCVAENVKGLICGNAKGYVREIADRFRELGYEVQLFCLNAAKMEVPQRRERVFFVANRCGFPKIRLDFGCRPVTFAEIRSAEGVPVAGDVGGVASTRRLLDKARVGDRTLADVAKRERGRNIGFTTPLIWGSDVPNTVTAGGEMVRMPDRAYCSLEDYRAMGTFPEDYDFDPGNGDPKRGRRMCKYMVGMSVPPSMTAHIADEIWRQWLGPAHGGGDGGNA